MVHKSFYIDEILYYKLNEVSKNKKGGKKKLIPDILNKELPLFKPIEYNFIVENSKKLQVDINESINKQLKNTSDKYELPETEIIRQILYNYVFDTYFIKFDKPLYFNVNELLNKKETTATDKAPINNLHEYYIIFGIPNNLDTWSNKHNTYCYDNNLNKHKGFLLEMFSNKIICPLSEMQIKYLYFDLTLNTNKPTLNIKLFDMDELFLMYNNVFDETTFNYTFDTRDLILESKIKKVILSQYDDILKNYDKEDFEFIILNKYKNMNPLDIINLDVGALSVLNSLENTNYDNFTDEFFSRYINNLNDDKKEFYFINNLLNMRFTNKNILKPYKVHKILKYVIDNLKRDNEQDFIINPIKTIVSLMPIELKELENCYNSKIYTIDYKNYIKCLWLIEFFLNSFFGVKPVSY